MHVILSIEINLLFLAGVKCRSNQMILIQHAIRRQLPLHRRQMFSYLSSVLSSWSSSSSRNMSASTSTALATDTPKLVEDLIANNRIAVFSKSWCPYCKRAKALLASNYADVPAEVIEYVHPPLSLSFPFISSFSTFPCVVLLVHIFYLVSEVLVNNKFKFDYRIDGLGDSKCSEIQDYLLEKTGQRSVPNIFIGMLLIYIFPESHKAYFFSISISDQKHIGGNYRSLTLFNPV